MKYLLLVLAMTLACGERELIEEQQGAETAPCPNTGGLAFPEPPIERGMCYLYSEANLTGWRGVAFAPNNGSSSGEYSLAAYGWFPSQAVCGGAPDVNGPNGTFVRSLKCGPDTAAVLFSNDSDIPGGGNVACEVSHMENIVWSVDSYCGGHIFRHLSIRVHAAPSQLGLAANWSTCPYWGTRGTGDWAPCGFPDSTGRWARIYTGMRDGDAVRMRPSSSNFWQGYSLNYANGWLYRDIGTANMPLSTHPKYGLQRLSWVVTGPKASAIVKDTFTGAMQMFPPNSDTYTTMMLPNELWLYASP